MAAWLVGIGANLNVRSCSMVTPLSYAAFNGHTECVRMLLSSVADATFSDDGGNLSLHRAAFRGHAACEVSRL